MREVIERLDQLIATTKTAAIPLDSRWLDADGVGAMLGFAPRYVLEKLATRPDFPKPMRLDGSGHPRWLASEIHEFAKNQQSKAVGR